MGEIKIKKEFIVEKEEEDLRLDRFLQIRLKGFTRSRTQRLIKDKNVMVSGRFEKTGYRVKTGEKIEIVLTENKETEVFPEPIPIDILYEDDFIIVLNKPAGMVVHTGAGVKQGTLVNAMLYHRPEISEVGSEKRPGIVHRLDKDTSGIMVVAKNDFAYHFLQREFKERRVRKEYIAMVKCTLKEKKGKIDLPIGRDRRDRKKISERTSKPRDAITEFEVIRETEDGIKILSVKPKTGRTHQIRVHLKSIGCPIMGDKKYGGAPFPRLALHSYSIAFLHPFTKKEVKFVAPVPEELIWV